MKWSDIDFEKGTATVRPTLIWRKGGGWYFGEVGLDKGMITVAAFNTKTMRARTISLTARLARELEALAAQAPKRPDDLVFGISDNVKRSFDTVRRAVGLEDVRFHDLRHYADSRIMPTCAK